MEAMLLPQDESEPPGTIALQRSQGKKAKSQKQARRFKNDEIAPAFYGEIFNGRLDLKPKPLQPQDPRITEFRAKYYPEVTDAE